MKTWKFVDKTKMEPGEWQNEPDKVQWVDEATGLDCLIVRNGEMGNLCGYVGVPSGHQHFEKDYDELYGINVHGGLTFSDFCAEDHEHGICHVPEPGRPERVWWLGFDCGHGGDFSPGLAEIRGRMSSSYLARGEIYRNLDYVKDQCGQLAKELMEPSYED